jgi:hypothetical protein
MRIGSAFGYLRPTTGNSDYVDRKLPFVMMKGEFEALCQQLLQHDANLSRVGNTFCIRLASDVIKIGAKPVRPTDDLLGVEPIRKGDQFTFVLRVKK